MMRAPESLFFSPNIWSLTPVPDIEFLNLLANRSIFCSNEITLGGLLVGAGHQNNQAMTRGLELLTLFFREGLEIELVNNKGYMIKPQ